MTGSLKFRVMTKDFFWVMTLTRSRSTTLINNFLLCFSCTDLNQIFESFSFIGGFSFMHGIYAHALKSDSTTDWRINTSHSWRQNFPRDRKFTFDEPFFTFVLKEGKRRFSEGEPLAAFRHVRPRGKFWRYEWLELYKFWLNLLCQVYVDESTFVKFI